MQMKTAMITVLLVVGMVTASTLCREKKNDDDPDPCRMIRSYSSPYDTHLRLYFYPNDLVEGRYERDRYYSHRPNYKSGRFHKDEWHRHDVWYLPTQRPRIRLGIGKFRLTGRHDAELVCDFPYPQHVISNIVWVRADLPESATRELYRRMNGVLERRGISTLYLHDVTPYDTGLYRCLATARDPNSNLLQTVFQDVHFYPDV